MNALEAQLDYCLGTATPEPGRAIEVAPGVRWARMELPFALNHINVWLLRDRVAGEGGEPAREGWSIVDCGIDDAATHAAWEEVFATGLDGLPVLRVIVHPHAPRPHRLGELAVRALERAPLDQRHRLRHRPHGEQRQRRLRRAALGGVHGGARHGRRSGRGRRRRLAHQLLPQPGARGAVVVPAPARRRHVRDRHRRSARRVELPRRLRPFARAHGVPLRVDAAS